MNTAIVQVGRGKSTKVISWGQLMSKFLLPPDVEFLPQDYWDTVYRGGIGNGQNTSECIDLSKQEFLWTLSTKLGGFTFQAISWKNKGRHYIAFIVPGQRTGRKLALVEADRTLNRLYAFDAEMPCWYQTAQIGKDNFRPINRQNYPEFKRAMNHNHSFKTRIVELIRDY